MDRGMSGGESTPKPGGPCLPSALTGRGGKQRRPSLGCLEAEQRGTGQHEPSGGPEGKSKNHFQKPSEQCGSEKHNSPQEVSCQTRR